MAKHFVSNKDESVRMFKSDFLESLSKVHPMVPAILYVPVICWLLFSGLLTYKIGIISSILFFTAGIFIWSLTEYVLHRFVFHFYPESDFGKKIHFIFHGVHHDYPNDSRRLVMPPSVSIPLASLFFFLFRWIFGPVLIFPVFAGFLSGYLFYDLTHYALHHFNFKNKFWQYLKHHHMLHHFQDSSNGFGVSSNFWDKIFRTEFPQRKKIK